MVVGHGEPAFCRRPHEGRLVGGHEIEAGGREDGPVRAGAAGLEVAMSLEVRRRLLNLSVGEGPGLEVVVDAGVIGTCLGCFQKQPLGLDARVCPSDPLGVEGPWPLIVDTVSVRLCRFRKRSGACGFVGVRADVADRGVAPASVVAVRPPEHGPVGGGLVRER